MSIESVIVQEVRQRAMEISKEFDHDVRKYGAYLRRKQQDPQYRDRVVSQLTVVSPTASNSRTAQSKVTPVGSVQPER